MRSRRASDYFGLMHPRQERRESRQKLARIRDTIRKARWYRVIQPPKCAEVWPVFMSAGPYSTDMMSTPWLRECAAVADVGKPRQLCRNQRFLGHQASIIKQRAFLRSRDRMVPLSVRPPRCECESIPIPPFADA